MATIDARREQVSPQWEVEVGESFTERASITLLVEGGKVLVEGWAYGLEDQLTTVPLSPAQARLMADALRRLADIAEAAR